MNDKSDTRSCPFCAEEIRAEATRCKHCRSDIPPEAPSHGGTCPYCKEAINPEAIKCKHCGSWVGVGQTSPLPEVDTRRCSCSGSGVAFRPIGDFDPTWVPGMPNMNRGLRCVPVGPGLMLCCFDIPVSGPEGTITWTTVCYHMVLG